jgi:hypothetical protein
VLHPIRLPAPAEPLVGAEAINELLRGWREGQPPLAESRPLSIASTNAR